MTSNPPLSASARWVRLALVAGLFLFLGFLALPGPASRMPLPFMPCAFHSISGLPCLFCGGTRAVRAILHGDLHMALYLNSLAFPALLLLCAVTAALLLEAATGRKLAAWEPFFRRASRFAPLLFLLAGAWWIFHICLALKTPKPELVNFANPIAAKAKALSDRTGY